MRKHYLAIAVLALALGMTACSSKTSETTQATTTESAADVSAAPGGEVSEEEYYYGFVGEVNDKIITVADDEGQEVKFDVSGAVLDGADAIGTGDEVEVAYSGELSLEGTKANAVEVITSAAAEDQEDSAEEADELISGTIESADDNTLTLKTEDGTYTFNSIIAQKVTKDGIKAGAAADVTFYGDLDDADDNPVATKIVTEDAKDTEDAKVNTLTGKVAECDSSYVVLDTADPANTLFRFLGTEGMFDGVKVGDTVTVIYQGTLTEKAVVTTGLKK